MLTTRLAWGMLVAGLIMLMVKSEPPVPVRASELRDVHSDHPVLVLEAKPASSGALTAGLGDVLPAIELPRRLDLTPPLVLPSSNKDL